MEDGTVLSLVTNEQSANLDHSLIRKVLPVYLQPYVNTYSVVPLNSPHCFSIIMVSIIAIIVVK